MVLHLSGDVVLPLNELVAILDIRALDEPDTAAFVKRIPEERTVRALPGEGLKSVVVASGAGGCRVFFSPISSLTLARRAAFMHTFEQKERDDS